MRKKRARFLLMSLFLLGSLMTSGKSVAVFCTQNVPAIQFAAQDIIQALDQDGSSGVILPVVFI